MASWASSLGSVPVRAHVTSAVRECVFSHSLDIHSACCMQVLGRVWCANLASTP